MACIYTTKEKSDKLSAKSSDQDFTRSAMIAEADAISLYQSQIENSTDPEFIKVVNHIMDEEKEHLTELACVLGKQDPTQREKLREILKIADIEELECVHK